MQPCPSYFSGGQEGCAQLSGIQQYSLLYLSQASCPLLAGVPRLSQIDEWIQYI